MVDLFKRKYSLIPVLLQIISIIFVVENAFCYYAPSMTTRIILIITFLVLLIALFANCIFKNYSLAMNYNLFILLLSSAFFLFWRSSLSTSYSKALWLNSENILLMQKYSSFNHLIYDSPHAYFFSEPVILHFLCEIGGFSVNSTFYVSLFIFGVLAGFTGVLLYKTLSQNFQTSKRYEAINLFFSLIAFSIISFAFSERSGKATNFVHMLTLITLWFTTAKDFRNRRENLILLLLITGITIGDTNGILLLIPFFIFYSLFARNATFIVYSLIPLSYLMFSAYSYTLRLQSYITFAIQGFIEFIEEILFGQFPERIIPWQRTSNRIYEDIAISSIAYLSLFALSILAVILTLLVWLKTRKEMIRDKSYISHKTYLICVMFWLIISLTVYIGAAFKPETSFSDIRTIVIVLLSLMLPFLLTSKESISYIKSHKIWLLCICVTLVLASMRTIYEVYPKSIQDPINVVEDARLGSTSIHIVANFVNTYYETGGILADYSVLSYIGRFLPSALYEKQFLSEKSITVPFTRFPYKGILIFNIAGVKYPSIYHSPEAYRAAYNFSLTHNRIYDNGIVVISSMEK